MKGVDREGRRVQVRIRERRLVVHDRGRSDAWRDDECLNAEAADEALVALSLIIRLDVALIPRQAKGRLWDLNHKEIEVRIRRQPTHVHVHHLDRPKGSDPHLSSRMQQAGGLCVYHVEGRPLGSESAYVI